MTFFSDVISGDVTERTSYLIVLEFDFVIIS